MSFFQKLFTSILPRKWAEDMEAHSRSWMIKCRCGYERSIWEIGGIRWRAIGNQKTPARCPSCGKRSWHTVYRKHGEHKP
jgi:hypothetical protein